MSAVSDDMKGYKGRSLGRLLEHGIRVWSEVRVTNDAGQYFRGGHPAPIRDSG